MTTKPGGDYILYVVNPGLPSITTVTKTLSYTDSEWGDLLTSYDGLAITYDEIGNPLSYYNGSAYTMEYKKQGERFFQLALFYEMTAHRLEMMHCDAGILK